MSTAQKYMYYNCLNLWNNWCNACYESMWL